MTINDSSPLRGLGRSTLIYAAGTLISRVASLLMLPIYTHVFAPREYGLLQLIDMTVEIAGIMVSAGIATAVLRCYFTAADDVHRRDVLANGWLLLLLLNVGGMLLLFLVAPFVSSFVLKGEGSTTLVRVAALSFAASALPIVPLVAMQAQQRPKLFLIATLAKLAIQISLNLLFLVHYKMGPIGVILSTLIANLSLGLPASVWLLRDARLVVRERVWKGLLRYALPLQIGQIAMFMLAFGDRYFLQAHRDLTTVGIYALAYQFGFLLSTLGGSSFLQAWTPQRFQSIALERHERDRQSREGFAYFNIFVISLAVGISLFSRPLLAIMASDAFQAASDLVPLLILSYVVHGWTAVVHFGIDVSGETKYSSYANWIGAAAVMALYALLIPPFGSWGAAMATLFGFLVRFGFVYMWAQRLWPVAYEWKSTARLLLLGITAVLLGASMRSMGQVVQLAVASVVSLFFLAAVWLLVLNPELRTRISRELSALTRAPLLLLSRH